MGITRILIFMTFLQAYGRYGIKMSIRSTLRRNRCQRLFTRRVGQIGQRHFVIVERLEVSGPHLGVLLQAVEDFFCRADAEIEVADAPSPTISWHWCTPPGLHSMLFSASCKSR